MLLISGRSGTQYVAMVTELLTFKLILCCTFSRTLLEKIKHFCYKLAEISFFIISDQNLVEYMTSSLS